MWRDGVVKVRGGEGPKRLLSGGLGVQAVGLKVTDVVVLIDREQGGPQRLKESNLTLHSAFTLTAILKVQSAPVPFVIFVLPCSMPGWHTGSCQRMFTVKRMLVDDDDDHDEDLMRIMIDDLHS